MGVLKKKPAFFLQNPDKIDVVLRDMADFNLSGRFKLILILFRIFQILQINSGRLNICHVFTIV
ncbi:MAG: hypothetical protein BLM47_07185 [Candidatus Reconcilbacillus cellulovorans]|uniref:Uncharacterized protein n=1 Tax=Candidatus Reconcilbacillus cellulovorans TaxID=1906605 RepID=A0A2A6E043_9BACL|nr:MAG: hypothetical protein BLM47_07185 [Candidatus Reconcilbacillus cellulovorans]